MAEALATASAIAGLLSLTIEVAKISQRYVSGVKHASQSVKSYHRELEAMTFVLARFEQLVAADDNGQVFDITLLGGCQQFLNGLRTKLSKRTHNNAFSESMHRLAWPFLEEDTRRIVETLHRYQSYFHAIISAESHSTTAKILLRSESHNQQLADIRTHGTKLLADSDQQKERDKEIAEHQIKTLEKLERYGQQLEDVQQVGSNTRMELNRQAQKMTSDRRKEIISHFATTDPSVNHAAARRRHEAETGQWLLKSPDFSKWSKSRRDWLWLHGIPGSGKTILCSTVISHLKTQKPDHPILFYYFDFNDPQKQNVKYLLSSLLAQCCRLHNNLPRKVEDLFDQSQNPNEKGLIDHDVLLQALLTTCRSVGPITIVVDALDECTEREILLEVLQQASEFVQKMHMEVSWLVTSRREKDIEEALLPIIQHNLTLETKLVDSDIFRYVSSCLQKDRKLCGRPEAVKEKIKQVLVKGACGMFRWTVCQLDVLRSCLTPKSLYEALATLPKTLDGTYERILLAIAPEYRDYAFQALEFIAFSARPVHYREVAEAAVVVPDVHGFQSASRLFDPKDILTICSSLVTFLANSGEIRLAHYSVKEFLLSSRIRDGPASAFALETPAANRHLSEICLTYLLTVNNVDINDLADIYGPDEYDPDEEDPDAEEPQPHPDARALSDTRDHEDEELHEEEEEDVPSSSATSPLPLAVTVLEGEYPLLTYAAECWIRHFRMAKTSLRKSCTLLDLCRTFLDEETGFSFLAWKMSLQHRLKVDTGVSIPSPEPMYFGYMLSPLWYMARFGLDKLVDMLLRTGSKVNDALSRQVSTRGAKDDVMMRNMWNAHKAIGKLLERQDVWDRLSISSRTINLDFESESYHEFHSENVPVLLAAIHSGSYKCVDLLLQAGASVTTIGDIDTKKAEGCLSLDVAMACWTKGMYPAGILQAAVLSGSMQLIERILEAGADVNAPGGEDDNALCTAIRLESDPNIIQILLDYGANIEAEGTYYDSPLQAAAARPSFEITKLLLRAGANVNAKGSHYGSVLLAAIQNYAGGESNDVITTLLDAGADVNIRGLDGPPLHMALEEYAYSEIDLDVISLLISHDADVHHRSTYGSTALGIALHAGCDEDAIEILLSAGSTLEKVEERGLSAWEVALEESASDNVLIVLLKHGADPNASSEHRRPSKRVRSFQIHRGKSPPAHVA